jgi:hypothetical protein
MADSRLPVQQGPCTYDAPTQLFVPLVALAHAPWARDAAVIGFGSGMASHALLGSPTLQHVVTIEIEPEMINAARTFLPANRRAFDDPRSSFVIDDARAYFAARAKKFDLIVSEPSNPWVSGCRGLFTTEFYGRIKGYLTPKGVFAQWLHLYEIDDGLVLSVIAALSEHFRTTPSSRSQSRHPHRRLGWRHVGGARWSIFQYSGVVTDLQRVWPITAHTMETLRVGDNRSFDPLIHMAGVPRFRFLSDARPQRRARATCGRRARIRRARRGSRELRGHGRWAEKRTRRCVRRRQRPPATHGDVGRRRHAHRRRARWASGRHFRREKTTARRRDGERTPTA